eukprot:GHUV01003097.1.p1 GENE.GHUV01003097.1~~GHUV01003097.1.p1  ORF type:complete len:302 (+),score=91.18 GHUV01003097.1:40-945(+)
MHAETSYLRCSTGTFCCNALAWNSTGRKMRFLALLLLACSSKHLYGRELQQASQPTATYGSLAQAVAAANQSAPNLSILLQAVQAANVTSALGPNTTWTILAPTNEAFTTRLNESLGITPQQLLQPANKQTLVDVLSYHVIPGAAVLSSNLTDGQEVATALQGADPLTVSVADGNVVFQGAQNNATVTIPDIRAGRSVIHVVDDVLLPAGVGSNGTDSANGTAVGGGAAVGANDTAPSTAAGTAVGGGAAASGAAPDTSRNTAPGTAVGGGAAASPATAAAGAAKVPAALVAGMLLLCIVF